MPADNGPRPPPRPRSTSVGLEKQVSFQDCCALIPSSPPKERFFSRRGRSCSVNSSGMYLNAQSHLSQLDYSPGAPAQWREAAPVASAATGSLTPKTRTRAPVLSLPRYETRSVSVPLSPLRWGGPKLFASISRLSVDVSTVAGGVAGGFAGSGAAGHKSYYSAPPVGTSRCYESAAGSSTTSSRCRRPSPHRNGSSSKRTPLDPATSCRRSTSSLTISRPRSSSFGPSASDRDTSPTRRPSLESLASFYSDSDVDSTETHDSAFIPNQPRCLRIYYPMWTGWQRERRLARAESKRSEAQLKGCLIHRSVSTPVTANDQFTPSLNAKIPQSLGQGEQISPQKPRVRPPGEGPPVVHVNIIPPSPIAAVERNRSRPRTIRKRPSLPRIIRRAGIRSTPDLASAAGRMGVGKVDCVDSGVAFNGQRPPDQDLQVFQGNQSGSPGPRTGRKEEASGVEMIPLNADCCNDCAAKISHGLSDAYKPIWTRSARRKYLSDRQQVQAAQHAIVEGSKHSETHCGNITGMTFVGGATCLSGGAVGVRSSSLDASALAQQSRSSAHQTRGELNDNNVQNGVACEHVFTAVDVIQEEIELPARVLGHITAPSRRNSIQADEVDKKRNAKVVPFTADQLIAEQVIDNVRAGGRGYFPIFSGEPAGASGSVTAASQ